MLAKSLAFIKGLTVEAGSEEIAGRVRKTCGSHSFDEGIELVEVEYRREARGWVLGFIDREGGITLKIAPGSAEKSEELDVEDFIMAPYISRFLPRSNAILKSEKDFMKYRSIGQ
jgi:hypothetical protein